MNLEDTCNDEEFGTISHLNIWCPTLRHHMVLPAFAGLIEENIYRLFLRGRPCFNHPNLALSMRIPVQKSRGMTWLHSLHSSPETSETRNAKENAKGHQWHRGICSLIYHEAQDEEQDDDLGSSPWVHFLGPLMVFGRKI